MLPFGLQTVHICFNLQTGSASNLTICVGQLGKKFLKYYNHTLGEANHGANTGAKEGWKSRCTCIFFTYVPTFCYLLVFVVDNFELLVVISLFYFVGHPSFVHRK